MGLPFIGSKFVAPSLFRSSFRSSSDRRRKRSFPQRPTNMFLFTKAASFPKTSRTVTLGSFGRVDLKNSLEPSSGRGIFNVSSPPGWMGLVEHSFGKTDRVFSFVGITSVSFNRRTVIQQTNLLALSLNGRLKVAEQYGRTGLHGYGWQFGDRESHRDGASGDGRDRYSCLPQ